MFKKILRAYAKHRLARIVRATKKANRNYHINRYRQLSPERQERIARLVAGIMREGK